MKFFWAIYSQIPPKIMRWHQFFRTKTPKKWKTNTNVFLKWMKIWMKILHIDGCKAFSIQNINECKNM
jgi:hypothetical protein